MAKKKKKWHKIFISWDHRDISCSDGVVIMRPEIRIVGSFSSEFSTLFYRYTMDKLEDFVFDELGRFLPVSDDEPAPASSKEVPGDE